MSSIIADHVIHVEPVAVRAWVENRQVYVELHDDRVLSFPARKFTRLKQATDELLSKVRVRAQGSALRWDALDEDLLVEGLVQGIFEED